MEGMNIHPILYWECSYLSMLGLKLNHFNERVPGPHNEITLISLYKSIMLATGIVYIHATSYCFAWGTLIVVDFRHWIGEVFTSDDALLPNVQMSTRDDGDGYFIYHFKEYQLWIFPKHNDKRFVSLYALILHSPGEAWHKTPSGVVLGA